MKAATCIRFSHYFKPASYLQYHPEYKKPATKLLTLLDSFIPRFTLAQLYQASLTKGGGVGGGKGIL